MKNLNILFLIVGLALGYFLAKGLEEGPRRNETPAVRPAPRNPLPILPRPKPKP